MYSQLNTQLVLMEKPWNKSIVSRKPFTTHKQFCTEWKHLKFTKKNPTRLRAVKKLCIIRALSIVQLVFTNSLHTIIWSYTSSIVYSAKIYSAILILYSHTYGHKSFHNYIPCCQTAINRDI